MDLTKILKHAPRGFKLYSTIYGDIEFDHIDKSNAYPIILRSCDNLYQNVTKHGKHIIEYEENAECILFPSKDQRDWSKFTAPWYNEHKKDVKEKFGPKTLKPFDKILARDIFDSNSRWVCSLFSHYDESEGSYPCRCVGAPFSVCIPYNDDTKHLVGTKEEAPKYYRYWED